MAKADEEDDERQMADPGAIQPSQRLFVQRNHARYERAGRKMNRNLKRCNGAPDDQDHDHDGGDDHDLDGLLARFVDSLGIFPPEVNCDQRAEAGGKRVLGKVSERMAHVPSHVLNKARQVLACDHRADRTSQNVIEEQRRNRELGESPSHGLFDDAVNAAAHEHAARLDVQSTDGIAEQHDREDEPGCALADHLLSIAARVIGGGGQVRQNDGGGAPERNEGQHHRGGDEDLYCRF